MLGNTPILCFAPEPWDAVWRNRHQILSRLARRTVVLWVEPRPYLRQVLRSQPSGGPRLRHVQDGLWVYRPPRWAPLTGRRPLQALTEELRDSSLRRALAQLDMERPILWLCRPWQADVVGRYGEQLLLYHVVDEYAMYEAEFVDQVGREAGESIAAQEEALLRRADLVIATSPALLEAKRRVNPNTYLVRNGVNCAAFSAVLGGDRPPAMAALPRPIIGCAGVINEKIDLALLRDVAQARPDWSLAMIGPITLRYHRAQLQWLELPNVHFLGHQPVDDLPQAIAACDVCLMPYKINEWTRHIDPLKMYEYLAAGKPVVTTDIPAARELSPPLRIAHDAPEFVSEIAAALQETGAEDQQARRHLATQHDWEARVAQIEALIAAALGERERMGGGD